MSTCKNRIHFETRLEIRPDMAIIETFQDGSQLVRKKGLMVIVDSIEGQINFKRLKANAKSFSFN